MTVHPQAQVFLDAVAGAPPLDTQTAEQNRADLESAKELIGTPTVLSVVYDSVIAGVPVRIYSPHEEIDSMGAVVYLHGGGWVLGDLDLADTATRDIAVVTDAVVISVDYRLAPENPFPAAVEDVVAVTASVLDGTSGLDVDTNRVAVAGDSAGGNLAAVVAQQLRHHEPALAHQALIYPATVAKDDAFPSYTEFGTDHFLTSRDLSYFYATYAGDHDRHDVRLSPGLNPDLTGLPPATVVTAECDPLRDDGESYAQALTSAGVPVTAVRFKGMVHPFVYLAGIIDAAKTARRLVGGEIRASFEERVGK